MNSNYKPLIVAVFLVVGGLASGALFFPKTGLIQVRGILGGPDPSPPAIIDTAEGAQVSEPTDSITALKVEGMTFATPDPSGQGDDAATPPTTADPSSQAYSQGAIADPGTPIGPALDHSKIVTYTIQAGDNLSSIASYFGVSVDTIVSANPGVRTNTLRVGAQLKILPTSGVIYQSQSGDTLASISSQFNIPQDTIVRFNQSVNFASLDPGTSIVIPGGTSANLLATQSGSLPNFNSEFIMPAQGYNWGILHHYNAVDIANSCGTPVVAAADGLVIPDENIPDTPGGWNGGYGNFVLLEHSFGNGVRTRYAHLEQVLVQIGDFVKQGQEIGLMGESGEATGCHVHFEVIGAQNPFAKS